MIACCQSGSDAKLTARALPRRGLSGARYMCSSQSEKRSDDHNVRVRLRTRRSRAELMLKSETVNPEHVRGEMAKLNPSKATETSLDSTNRDDERLPQRRTARKQWQRNAFTNFTGVPRNPRKLARELMTGNRRKCISKLPIQRYGETPGSFRVLGSFIATHGNVPRKIRAADQSKRD